MPQAIAQIVLRALITLLLSVGFAFVILRLDGDPLRAIMPLETPPEALELLSKKWGLDQPIHVQFLSYISNLLQGDFGSSLENGQSALHLVMQKVPATLQLMSVAMVIGLAIGVPLGVLAAQNRGKFIDRMVMALAVLTHSIPSFLIAILLTLLLAVQLRLLPSTGGETPAHLVMPGLVIGLSMAGVVARFVRSSTLEVLGQRYILAARAKRLENGAILARHVAPNAALPLLTLLGFMIGGMIGGAAIVETVYAWPGVGRYMVAAVAKKDVAVVQTVVILVTTTMVLANLTIDFLTIMLDPRLRNRAAA